MLNVSWVQYPITRSKQAIYPSVLLFTEQYQTAQTLSTKQHYIIWWGIFRARCLVHRQYVKKNRASFGCQGFHEKCSVSGPPIYQRVDISCKLKLASRNRDRWDTTFLMINAFQNLKDRQLKMILIWRCVGRTWKPSQNKEATDPAQQHTYNCQRENPFPFFRDMASIFSSVFGKGVYTLKAPEV